MIRIPYRYYKHGEAKHAIAGLEIGAELTVPTFAHAQSMRQAGYHMARRLNITKKNDGYRIRRIT